MIMFNPNEPVKVDQLQKVENQSMSNGTRYRNGKQFF